jgi:chemotaxis methyl-accepting protein methylase
MNGVAIFLRNTAGRVLLSANRKIWRRLPASLRRLPPGRSYGMHLHSLVLQFSKRSQNHSTFFLRNRPELELIRRLADQEATGSSLDVTVLACSKGAEVYSIAWTMRSARPDLKLTIHAIDISEEIVEFARNGVYSLKCQEGLETHERADGMDELTWNTFRDQGRRGNVSIFDRMTKDEMEAMFDIKDGFVTVKSWLKEGITWRQGDAGNPELARILGPQDMVVANRFLCHMKPVEAERCLRTLARLARTGGHVLVSGVDLDVRTRVAQELGWKPVTDLIQEVHEGDASLMDSWPLDYWGREPFTASRPDSMTRYATAFVCP